MRQTWRQAIAYSVADGTAIANSTTETLIFSPAPTIQADTLADGKIISGRCFGKYSTTATPTLRFRLRYGTATGGVLLADTGTVTLTTITNAIFFIEFWLTVRSNGSAGTLFAFIIASLGSGLAPSVGSATNASADVIGGSAGVTAPAVSAACDFTAATALSLTATWSAASASNTLTGNNLYMFDEN